MDNFLLKNLEKQLEVKLNLLKAECDKLEIQDVLNPFDLKCFIDFVKSLSNYIMFLNNYYRLRRISGLGLASSYAKEVTKYCVNMEVVMSRFLGRDIEQVTSVRKDKMGFLDDISELEKIQIYVDLMIALEVFEETTDDKRIVAAFFDTKTKIFIGMKNWLNFRKIFDVLDGVGENYIELDIFLKIFGERVKKMAMDCGIMFELSKGTNILILNVGIKLLGFLIKLNQLRSSFLETERDNIKKTHDIWQNKLG